MKTFASIQAMRGIAASTIVMLHVTNFRLGMGFDWFAKPALTVLPMGVDLFFIISGFIMTTRTFPDELGRSISPLRFALERGTRIYPLYWIVLSCALIISYWPGVRMFVPSPEWVSTMSIGQVFLTTINTWFVPPAWTLFYEIIFYAVVTVALLISPRRVLPITAVLLLALTYFETILPEFLFGAAIAMAVRRNLIWNGYFALLLAVPFISVGVYLAQPGTLYGFPRIFTYGFGAVLLIYGSLALELRKGLVFPKAIQYLGNASYSIYLWHWPIGATLAALDPLRLLPYPVHMLGWIALCFVGGIASYEWMERPMLSLSRHFIRALLARMEMEQPILV